MVELNPVSVTVGLLLVQALGLASMWLARSSEGSASEVRQQRMFFAALVLVGLTTAGSVMLGPGEFLISGTTFATMMLGAVWDPGLARD